MTENDDILMQRLSVREKAAQAAEIAKRCAELGKQDFEIEKLSKPEFILGEKTRELRKLIIEKERRSVRRNFFARMLPVPRADEFFYGSYEVAGHHDGEVRIATPLLMKESKYRPEGTIDIGWQFELRDNRFVADGGGFNNTMKNRPNFSKSNVWVYRAACQRGADAKPERIFFTTIQLGETTSFWDKSGQPDGLARLADKDSWDGYYRALKYDAHIPSPRATIDMDNDPVGQLIAIVDSGLAELSAL